MAGPDIVLFVVGALLFGGAAAALVSEGGTGGLGGGSALGAFSVTYPLETAQVGEETVGNFQAATATFDVQAENVAKVVVVVQCADPVPAGGTFNLQIQVEGPNGLKATPTAASCGGAVEVPVEVADVPPDTNVAGRTQEEALGNLPRSENATRAVGEWTVTVNGNRAGAPVGVPAGNPSGSIVLNVEQWAPKLTPIQR